VKQKLILARRRVNSRLIGVEHQSMLSTSTHLLEVADDGWSLALV